MNVYLQTLTIPDEVINRSRHIFITLFVIILGPLSAFAVEDKPKTCPKEGVTKEDSVGIFEDDTKVNMDAVQITPAAPIQNELEIRFEQEPYKSYEAKSTENEKLDAEKDPNSAMSFNFIYYIIDKFKFTDPLE